MFTAKSETGLMWLKVVRQIIRYGILVIIGYVFILPFLLAFLAGFKSDTEIFQIPPSIIPNGWTGGGRFEEQTYAEQPWRIGEGWQVAVSHNQAVKDGDLLAIDADGQEIHAVFDATASLEYRLQAEYDWNVPIRQGQVVQEGDLLAVDREGNEIRATGTGIVRIQLFLPRLEGWEFSVRNRREVSAGETLGTDAEGNTIKANFAGTIYLEPADAVIEEPLALSRLTVSKAYAPEVFPLSAIFSDETRVIPEEEIFTATRLRQFEETIPYTIQFEGRNAWSARDQYGLSNWINVFRSIECRDSWLGAYCFPYWLWNSVFIAALNVSTRVFFALLAGYAFARMQFPGKNLVFTFMLATLMLPGAITLIPGYVLINDIGWVGIHWALVFPGLVEVFGIFLMTQFLKAIPRDLEEAARVDGASQWQIIWKVVLPLARPAIITLAILAFQGSWNAFQGPLLYLRGDNSVFTLPVGLQLFQQQFRQQWNMTLIGSMFNAIPVLIIFLIFNRYFVEGVSYSGVKG